MKYKTKNMDQVAAVKEKKSNLSESAQECMKRLPKLTERLRENGLVNNINDIMDKHPRLTYGDVVDTILDFDDVNQECITEALTNGDSKGETILSNYGRKCTNTIKQAGEHLKVATPEPQVEEPTPIPPAYNDTLEQQSNFFVQVTAIAPGRRFELEQKVSQITGYDQIEAKLMLKTLPAVIEVGLNQSEANEIAVALEQSGATVSVEQR